MPALDFLLCQLEPPPTVPPSLFNIQLSPSNLWNFILLIENLSGDALCNHFLLLLDEDVCQEEVALVPNENDEEGEKGAPLPQPPSSLR